MPESLVSNGTRIVVVEDLHGVPTRCPECKGAVEPRPLKYYRRETDTAAGFKLDVEVPYCPACRLTLVPKGLTLAAQLDAGWKAEGNG